VYHTADTCHDIFQETIMPPKKSINLKHLEWAVESRAKNQRCAVRLLTLFQEHEAQWKTRKWSRAAQDLLSTAFSLWRAAFLADKSGKRSEVFSHGVTFLTKVVEDNAISFASDRDSKEWTFNYYTRNARSSLQTLAQNWPEQVPEYKHETRTPTERWEYCEQLLEMAVAAFGKSAVGLRAGKAARKSNLNRLRESRAAAKSRRKKSRAITLEARKRQSSRSP
jgi:hypothetical protein